MKKFWLDCLFATIFVFVLMWAVSNLFKLKLFNAFDPIAQAMADFELTDYAFSNMRPDPTVDERIVLVNIGNLPRAGIAQQIAIISKHKPKVIGIDSYFNCEGGLRDTINCPQLLDTLANLILSNAIEEAGNVVLVSKLHQSVHLRAQDTEVNDSIEFSDPLFQDFSSHGYANLVTDAQYQEDVKICRAFIPQMRINNRDEYAFAVQMAMKFDPLKTLKFLDRNKNTEIINYRGNVEFQENRLKTLSKLDLATTQYPIMFYALDVDQVLNEEFLPAMIEGSIVIFGFLGEYFGDPSWNDKFFTPLNRKISGRANPDMFGLVVHANIVAMILNDDYVNELAAWQKYLIAVLFIILNIALFEWIHTRIPLWFDSLSLVIQVFQILLLMGFTIMIFANSNFKLDLTISLGAIAAVGPAFEFYINILKPALARVWLKFTNNRKGVLTP